MKKILIIAGILSLSLTAVAGSPAPPEQIIPDTVQVGIYITSIHNIDFIEREYSITFWLWMKYRNKKLNFSKYLEIPNAKTHTCEFSNVDSSKDQVSMLMKIQCVMKDSWKIECFPFDKQTLWLTIESSQFDKDSLIFVQDSLGGHIGNRVKYSLAGWNIDTLNILTGNSVYNTNFGDTPFRPSVTYSAYKVRVGIVRKSPGRLFWKMFLGMYVAFLISYVCFYIQPENFDSRFQLSVGALFAAIGNKYIVESSLPDSTTFTLVDALHALTLLFILCTIGATIVSLRIGKRYKTFSSRKWDMIVAQVILLLYLIGNAYFIIHSISQGHFAETWHAG